MSARSIAILAACALVGAAGMGLEVVGLAAAGLALGHARAGALGLASFVSAWAMGAYLAGRSQSALRPTLACIGFGAFLTAPVCLGALYWAAHGSADHGRAWSAAVSALLVLGLPQGALFALLVRAYQSVDGCRPDSGDHVPGIAAPWAANLFGCMCGAYGLGFFAVGASGRSVALLLAGACALLGALAASVSARAVVPTRMPGLSAAQLPAICAGLLLGVATAWLIGLEWILLRLGALLFESTQWALSCLLSSSLLGLCLGGGAASLLPARRGSARFLVLACVLGTGWPHAFVRFFAPEQEAGIADALALCVPALAPFGALLPVLYRLREGESGARVGGLLLHETWGAWVGAPLTHWLLVPRLGLGGSSGALCLLGLPAALALGRRGSMKATLAILLTACAAAVVYSSASELALHTSALARPEFLVRAFDEDGHFSVAVVDDGLSGERTLLTDRFRAAGTGRSYRYMRALAHLPLLLHGHARRVGVLALGTGTTLGAAALHESVESIDVLELSSAVVAQARHFREANRGVLDPGRVDPRVKVLLGDGRSLLAGRRGAYDVLTMEPLLPSSPFGVYLYTREFYARAKEALAPGGLLCQWIPPHALEPEAFEAVVAAAVEAFPWSGIFLFGQHAIVVAGPARPSLSQEGFAAEPTDTSLGFREGSELLDELVELGLADWTSLLATLVCEGSHWPSASRPLTDDDPWITLARPATNPLEHLDNLPANLERLAAAMQETSSVELEWTGPAGAGLERMRQGARALLQARTAHARSEYELRAGMTDQAARSERYLDERLARAGELLPASAVRELAEEVEFVRSVRALAIALQGAAFERDDLDRALRAVELRPERADAHLYLACALGRVGLLEAARAALDAAIERCPRIFQTQPGARALALGWLNPELRNP